MLCTMSRVLQHYHRLSIHASRAPLTCPAPPSSPAGMDCIPRTLSRAQTFDSLSSMANIAGYR